MDFHIRNGFAADEQRDSIFLIGFVPWPTVVSDVGLRHARQQRLPNSRTYGHFPFGSSLPLSFDTRLMSQCVALRLSLIDMHFQPDSACDPNILQRKTVSLSLPIISTPFGLPPPISLRVSPFRPSDGRGRRGSGMAAAATLTLLPHSPFSLPKVPNPAARGREGGWLP